MSTMKNFDVYLRRAIRKEPADWSEHYVDYEMLKDKLSAFQQRRKALGKLLQGDTQLTYEDLSLAMADSGDSDGGGYFQYVNADEKIGEICSALMGAPTKLILTGLFRHSSLTHTTFFNRQ